MHCSDEQRAIVEAVSAGHSVLVNAVAGSGKTTTVLAIARANPSLSCTQVTYNKQLKIEVREKARVAAISNLEVHTYHSLAVRCYDPCAYDDVGIRMALDRIGPYSGACIAAVDILIIDEVQDMTPLYYQLMRQFARDAAVKTLVLLGDEYQSVYDFKNADARFLTLGDRCWPEFAFLRLPLSTSYRVTQPIAKYVNEVMLGESRIAAVKTGPKVLHLHGDIYKHAALFDYVRRQIGTGRLAPGDIFVLALSVKNPRSPIRRLEHMFVAAGLPCYIPISDDRDLDASIVHGKIVFTTFHQAKGRERDVVIVFGMDAGYTQVYSGDPADTTVPSIFYVAATRARKQLIVVEGSFDDVDNSAPFMKLTFDEMADRDFIYTMKLAPGIARERRARPKSVTAAVRFLDAGKLALLTSLVDEIIYTLTPAREDAITIAGTVMGKYGPEEIADITGVAIPLIFEDSVRPINVAARLSPRDDHLRDFMATIQSTDPRSAEWWLRVATLMNAANEDLHFRIAQLERYDWLSQQHIDHCLARLRDNIPISDATIIRFEIPSETDIDDEVGHISGIADCLVHEIGASETGTLWEFKCVSALTIEHKLQLICYAVIWRNKKYRLLNVCSGEVLAINDEADDRCNQVVKILLGATTDKRLVDNGFVERALLTVVPIMVGEQFADMDDV